MKELNMLVWLTQLGLSVAAPLGGFILLGVWLSRRFGLGLWCVLAGCGLGLICAVDSLRRTLKLMERMEQKNDEQLPVSYNNHD